MIPKNIRKEHIIKAIREIDKNGIPKGRKSKKFSLLYNYSFYPSKYVLALANKYANGVLLIPEEFGGGIETNSFLQGLGFKISQGNLRIGRIVLDIGVSMNELKRGGDAWTKHIELISKDFINNTTVYRNRIKKLVQKCIDENVYVVIFPARTMIYRNKTERDFYKNISIDVPWVVSGSININKVSNPDLEEHTEVFNHGKDIECFEIDIALWMQMDNFSSITAISSTITEIRKNNIRISKSSPPDENSHILAFDLGHHQYNGRYTRTMKSVLESIEIKSGKKKAIILAYWKYLNANPYYFWYEPYSPWIKIDRKQVTVENDVKVDFLDIIDIKL